MYIHIRPELLYVAAVIPVCELAVLNGKSFEEIQQVIEERLSEIVDVTRLLDCSITLGLETILFQWITAENEKMAQSNMQDAVEYCRLNYKKWYNIPLLNLD